MTEALTEEQVLWGAAAMMLKQHGDKAPQRVAERIGALALENDAAGMALWKEIARRLNEMIRTPQQ
ncbi:hypothetical protein BH11PSE5_BH11PSE5_16970 [soil metagenome]|jgi:hypothetical protein|tara:strand:+ start:7016 stop:7213 length:198 start_codon:yes stop_codon:yes gene_type:complete